MSKLEDTLESQLKILGLPTPEREVRFAAELVGLGRGVRERLRERNWNDWRLDFLYRRQKLAIEVQGGNFVNGRHTNATALSSEYKKINTAQLAGYTIFLFDTKMINSWEAANTIKEFLEATG